ncbi:hypothetical protein IWW36_004612 [Coemansia brasiliensis]|uniref:RING-type E3 ubiquitin transferase n=1 Tax=Coemansia brasiliensis TaxID=2650707 RepID=A0A9W8I9E3_9FUNG|nr:hypothetical protein IWW36_004612 [Coemansia brasiliensis]
MPPKIETTAAAVMDSETVSRSKAGTRPNNRNRPRKGKQSQVGKASNDKATESKESVDAGDEAVCFICADTVEFYAVGPCDHRTCFRCNLRLRELFKSKACPYCKAELPMVIYTREAETEFADLQEHPLPFEDKGLGIKFDCKEAYDATKHALQLNCPYRRCQYVAKDGWKGLKTHVRDEHTLQFCDLCLKNKMSFAHEHRLFTKAQLRAHYARGDNTGFTGHPSCQFCRTSFYDNDQLFDHCRKKHEQCFICVRNGIGRQVYYANYNTLEEHFNSDHFPCRHPLCLEKKFVVFENEIDLQSHELTEHKQALVGQRARREAKQVSLDLHYARSGASSTSRPSHRPSTMTVNAPDAAGVSIAGGRRPTGFGRVSENAPVPITSASSANASPVPESEQETLWPTLGSPSAAASSSQHSPVLTNSSMRSRAPAAFGHFTDNRTSSSSADSSRPSAEVAAKHQELLQRVSAFLSHREQPVERFRQLTTRYKNDQMSADEYVHNTWLLFLTVPGKNAKEMIQKTIRSVSDLLPDASQKERLTKALNDHRIKQQQFPALTPLTISRNSAAADPSARVLVIKPGSKASGSGKTQLAASSLRSSATKSHSEQITAPARSAYSSTPLSESAFPSLGSSSKSNAQAFHSSMQGASAHSSYSAKFSQSAGGSVSRALNAQPMASEFPDLPSASVPRRKIVPLDPHATSAWERSLGSSSSKKGNKKQSRNSKGKQPVYYLG